MNFREIIEPHLRGAGLAISFGLFLWLPGVSSAEGISGYAEYNYSLLNSKTTDSTGTTKTKSKTFNQRYNLTMDKELFPTLRFLAGGNFELDKSDNDTNGLSTNGTLTRINPNVDLSYSNGIFNGGLGFSRRQESSKSNGISTPSLFFDSYNGRFGWKPEDLPSLDILYSVFNNYDEHYTSQDSTSTSTIVNSRYKPIESVDLNYQANYSTLNSKLVGFESQNLNQSLRISYSDIFFGDRISVNTSYNINTLDSKTQNNGTASVSLPPSPSFIDQLFFVTSKTTDNPATTPQLGGPLNQNLASPVNAPIFSATALTAIRNNVGIKSNSSAVNIVRMPVTISTLNGSTIDAFFTRIDQVSTAISNAFALSNPQTSKVKVSQSPGSDGANWKLLPGATVTFGKLTNPVNGTLSVGFEIKLGETVPATTIIKIEIESIQAIPEDTASIQKITLAAPEAFLQDVTPVKPGQSLSNSQLSGLYDLNLKARILSVPIIFYDMSFHLDHTKSDTQAFTDRYSVVNGLSLNHRINSTLSTSARIAREDSYDPQAGSRNSDIASIALSSQTLPTLTQSVNYGYRQDTDAGITKKQHSLNLSNSADVYRGISFNLSGGGSLLTDNTGTDQKSLTVTSALNMVPHKTLSINLSASDSRSWSSGANLPETNSVTQAGDLSVTYNPLPSVYLFGSYTINAQKNRKTLTTQSIGGSWSPFRDGALLFNTSYRENIDNSGNKDRTIVEGLRWNIRAGWFLDLSYLIDMGTATSQTTDTQVFSTSLRMSF